MIRKDYHMHTNRCDGKATAEEMILAAIEQGLEEIGFSEHSYTSFDDTYCMSLEGTAEYLKEITALREKYSDRISIRIGLEMDRYSDSPTEGFEYWIGSTHYVRVPLSGSTDPSDGIDCSDSADTGEIPEGVLCHRGFAYIPVDESPEIQLAAAKAFFGGDMIAFAEAYFQAASEVVEERGCHIIGHFDLIAKFNEGNALFDEEDPRYISAWKKAVDRLIPSGVPFEINTGAISRGLRSQPYPSDSMREYIKEKGGSFILSSDSHRTDTLCYAFDKYDDIATEFLIK